MDEDDDEVVLELICVVVMVEVEVELLDEQHIMVVMVADVPDNDVTDEQVWALELIVLDDEVVEVGGQDEMQ